MEQKDFQELLKKYLSGQASPEEEKLIDAWYEAMGNRSSPIAGDEDEALEQRYWKNIEKHLHEAHPQTAQPGLNRNNTVRVLKYSTGIAASVLIALLTFFYVTRTSPATNGAAKADDQSRDAWTTLVNTKSTKEQYILPDSSSITLEPQSSIRYSSGFNSTIREVYLEGEAFFHVTHNAQKPFIVYANELTTKVLGTSFTIRSFKQDKMVSVIVKTGRVAVTTNALNKPDTKKELVLTPNQQVIYTKEDAKISRQIVETPQPLLAAEEIRSLHFEEAPLKTVIEAVEKVYGVDIVFDENVFSFCSLTTSLSGGGLYNRLDIICAAIGAKYTIEESDIVITGKGCN